MRTTLIAAALVAVGFGAAPGAAEAQALPQFPFCLFTGGDDGGFERCNYPSFQQCLFDRQAEGGVCYANPNFRAVEPPYRPVRPR